MHDDNSGGARALRVALRELTRRTVVRETPAAEASPPQLAQAETGGSTGPASSWETISSAWPVNGSGTGGFAGAGRSSRLDEDGNVVMSEAREGHFD
jgi:hypothetical protein